VRSDALRNRDRAIAGARVVLAERGLDAPLDAIARHAGIGNATLYRLFPSRCDLVAAACVDTLGEITAAGEHALTAPDPWAALADHLTLICELCSRDRALADLLTGGSTTNPEIETLREHEIANLRRLIRRAKRDGTIRQDCNGADVTMILNSTAGLAARSKGDRDCWRRHLQLLLGGLRASTG
jgi:AcrR family transcriptional regulator